MPDSDATASVRGNGRVVAAQNRTPAPDKNTGVNHSVASGAHQDNTAPRAAVSVAPDDASHDPAAATEPTLPDRATPEGSEIELKLLVDPDQLADFNTAPIVTANARNKGSRKHLKSVYYDTPKRDAVAQRFQPAGAPERHALRADGEGAAQRRPASPRRVGGERALDHARSHAGDADDPGRAARKARSRCARSGFRHRCPSPPAAGRSALGHGRDRLRPWRSKRGRAHAAGQRDRARTQERQHGGDL